MRIYHFTRWILILIGFEFGSFNMQFPSHDIYIGVVDIIKKSPHSHTQIVIKVFSNDLEDAITHASGQVFSFQKSPACKNSQELLESYFTSHLDLHFNGSRYPLMWRKCMQEGDTHRLYFELDTPTNWDKVEIEADFFLELFPTQTNIIKLSYLGQKRFGKLNSKMKRFEAEFE